MRICYHGTTKQNAKSILVEGFNLDSWFALHLEDALAFGGMHVLEVVFDKNKIPDSWQFHVLDRVSKENIIGYSVYRRKKVLLRDAT